MALAVDGEVALGQLISIEAFVSVHEDGRKREEKDA